MVRLKGPGMSQRASGTLAGQLTFGFTGKTHTLRKKPTPKQPRSGLQVSMRAMLTYISKQWQNLTANQQASWTDAYPDPQLSNYNAYIRHNLERWRSRRGISKGYPVPEDNTAGAAPELYASAHIRRAELLFYLDGAVNDNWAILIFHALDAAPAPNVDELIHVEFVEDELDHHFTHGPIPAVTHYYKILMCSDDGKMPLNIFATASCLTLP